MKNVIVCTVLLVSVLLIFSTSSYSQNFWQPRVSLTGAINELAIDSHGIIFAATNGKGLHRSTDEGATWTRVDTGSMKSYFYSIYIDNNDNIFAGSYLGEAYRSTDGGSTWKKFYLGDSTSLVTAFAVSSKGKIYAGTCGGGLARTTYKSGLFTSTDNGTTWDTLFAPEYPIFPVNRYVTSLYIDSRQNIFVGTYGAGLLKSTDDGDSWVKDGAEYWRINDLAASANNRLFVGTDNGFYYDSLQVDTLRDSLGTIKSIDTVRSGWRASGFYYDHTDTIITIKLDTITIPGDPPTVRVDTIKTFRFDSIYYHSRWYALSVTATPGGHIYAGTYEHGAYQSTDNGITWRPMSTGITDSTVTAVLLNPQTGYLYAGTTTGGFYRSTNPDPTFTPPQINQRLPNPVLATIEQNYPNPFNPTTSIPFTLPENCYTTLIIYDILGKEVVRLVDGVVTAGRHEIKWDASSVNTGVYFYRLQTPSTTTTGKLTLLK